MRRGVGERRAASGTAVCNGVVRRRECQHAHAAGAGRLLAPASSRVASMVSASARHSVLRSGFRIQVAAV